MSFAAQLAEALAEGDLSHLHLIGKGQKKLKKARVGAGDIKVRPRGAGTKGGKHHAPQQPRRGKSIPL